MYKLVLESTGVEAKKGFPYPDFRGDSWVLVGGQPPRHAGSTGRVYCHPAAVEHTIDTERSFFPNVLGMKWIEVKDE